MIDRLGLKERNKRLEQMILIRDTFSRVQVNDRDAKLYDALDSWVEKETKLLIGQQVPA